MQENNMPCPIHMETAPAGAFKEAVCIDTFRVYDSCADKDCLEDLRVFFTDAGQHVIDQACNVRIKDANVITVFVDLEPVPFNKGFYTVDMTYFFEVNLDVFLSPAACPVSVCGVCTHNKKVVLFGSEGRVKSFNNKACNEEPEISNVFQNLPKSTVQVAEPIGLSAKLACAPDCENHCHIPENICKKYGGKFRTKDVEKAVFVSLGVFSIVQIERNVQMLVPAYDFCLPEKECIPISDNPCELFNRIEFPTNEFFPPRATDMACKDPLSALGCGGCK